MTDQTEIPWPDLPPRNAEFFNSVWSPTAQRPSEVALTKFIAWLCFAGLVAIAIIGGIAYGQL